MKRDIWPVLFGVIISTLLAGTLVLAGLKAGITPGVSPLVILFAWGAFSKWATGSGGGRFLNLAQVAGSAGMAVTAGVIFTAPMLQILYSNLIASGNEAYAGLEVPPVDWKTLIYMCVAGALIGFGFVGLTTKRFLSDPTLPAPEARACEAMVEAAVTKPWKRPFLGRSLYLGVIAGIVAPLMVKLGVAVEKIGYGRTMAVGPADEAGNREMREFHLDAPFSPIYLGIGALLTISTALLVFGGSFLRMAGDAGLTIVPEAYLPYFPADSMRWVGGGAMTVAVAFSLFRFFQKRKPAKADYFNEHERDESLLVISKGRLFFLIVSVLAGFAMLFYWLYQQEGSLDPFVYWMSGAILLLSMLMVALGAILSLQIGSSASPVSGTVFVTTLVLCFVALHFGRTSLTDIAIVVPLIVAACVAVCTANDSSQDYKTMQLCGVRVQSGFLAQLLGLMAGAVIVPYSLHIAHEAYVLGSDQLTAPQGKLFATLIDGLLMQSSLPLVPIVIGLGIGVIAVVIEILASKKGMQLPSMALAVGIYLPSYLGIGILIGALFRWFGEGDRKQRAESILCAAGLITGAALFDLILGAALFREDYLRETFFATQADWTINGWLASQLWAEGDVISSKMLKGVALLGIIGIGFLIFFNSARLERDEPQGPEGGDSGPEGGPGHGLPALPVQEAQSVGEPIAPQADAFEERAPDAPPAEGGEQKPQG